MRYNGRWLRMGEKGRAHDHFNFPALTPLVSPAQWVHALKGITLPDVAVTVVTQEVSKREPRITSRGGFLWTHFVALAPRP